jgi:hypothetical protein
MPDEPAKRASVPTPTSEASGRTCAASRWVDTGSDWHASVTSPSELPWHHPRRSRITVDTSQYVSPCWFDIGTDGRRRRRRIAADGSYRLPKLNTRFNARNRLDAERSLSRPWRQRWPKPLVA